MGGVQGLGQRVAGAEGASELAASLDNLGLQVTPENVLAARTALLAEADRLDDDLLRHGPQTTVGLCGGDPVSAEAASAFNARIQRFLDQYRAHVATLRAAGHALEATARDYGHTEQQITASYRERYPIDGQQVRL